MLPRAVAALRPPPHTHTGAPIESACSEFVASFAGPNAGGPHTVFLDFPGSEGLGRQLQARGVKHVLCWPAGQHVAALPAMHFAHTFFGALGNPTTTVPEVGAAGGMRGGQG